MLSQRILMKWTNEAVKHFKSVMPPIDTPYPEIHIVSDRTMSSVRNAELKRTQSPAIEQYEIPAMETLHGSGGDSILVYQKRYNGVMWDPKDSDAKNRFKHFIWHEHGHFYAITVEDPSFIRFMDQKPHPEEYESLLGYAFWTEFIAEVIAGRVEPEPVIDWSHFNFYPVRNELCRYLYRAFNSVGRHISWYDLAFYFAKRLADKTTVGFIDAAKKGIVKISRPITFGFETVTFEEDGCDPTGLDAVDYGFHEYLTDLQVYLEKLLSRKEYWKVSLEELNTIGTKIYKMEKLMGYEDLSDQLPDWVRGALEKEQKNDMYMR